MFLYKECVGIIFVSHTFFYFFKLFILQDKSKQGVRLNWIEEN